MKKTLALILILMLTLCAAAFAEDLRTEEAYDDEGQLFSITYYNAADVPVRLETYSKGKLTTIQFNDEEGNMTRTETYLDGELYSYICVEPYDELPEGCSKYYRQAVYKKDQLTSYVIIKTFSEVPEGFVAVTRNDSYLCRDGNEAWAGSFERYVLSMTNTNFKTGVTVIYTEDGAIDLFYLSIYDSDDPDASSTYRVELDSEGAITSYMVWETFETVDAPDPDALPFDIPETYFAVVNAVIASASL